MPPKEQRGRLGRRLVIGLYTAGLSYLVIVGFASVVPQVFWPESDPSFDVSCAKGFRILHHDLEQMRLAYLSGNVIDPAGLRKTLHDWDRRLNALRGRCDADKVALLYRYRHHVELNLERYMREEAPLANRVAEALEPAASPSNQTTESAP